MSADVSTGAGGLVIASGIPRLRSGVVLFGGRIRRGGEGVAVAVAGLRQRQSQAMWRIGFAVMDEPGWCFTAPAGLHPDSNLLHRISLRRVNGVDGRETGVYIGGL